MPLASWRILLPRLAESPMDLDQELFEALLALDQKRKKQSISWNEVSSWSVNQHEASLTLFFEDNTEIRARIQIIGTFNGDTFLWGWSNPSIRDELKKDSLKLKEYGSERGWQLFSEKMFAATPRDGYAIAALASEVLASDGVYAGGAAGTITYLNLAELLDAVPPVRDPPESHEPSVFERLNSLVAAQVGNVQLKLGDLREVENICRRAYVQSQAGDHLAAVSSLDEAWERLGVYAVDQEPAGWIKLARGDALFRAGQLEEAFASLAEADRLHGCPDPALLYQRLGECYVSFDKQDKALDMFARVYVACGDAGLAHLSEVERGLFKQKLATRKQETAGQISKHRSRYSDGKNDEARALVAAFIEELYSFELAAYKEQEKARVSREIPSQMCAKDLEAREKINSAWVWLMAVWCTPFRLPCCTSIQFPPAHDPKSEKLQAVVATENGRIAVETAAEDSFGISNRWRYELEEVDGRVLVNQIYSVWDDEEFACI